MPLMFVLSQAVNVEGFSAPEMVRLRDKLPQFGAHVRELAAYACGRTDRDFEAGEGCCGRIILDIVRSCPNLRTLVLSLWPTRPGSPWVCYQTILALDATSFFSRHLTSLTLRGIKRDAWYPEAHIIELIKWMPDLASVSLDNVFCGLEESSGAVSPLGRHLASLPRLSVFRIVNSPPSDSILPSVNDSWSLLPWAGSLRTLQLFGCPCISWSALHRLVQKSSTTLNRLSLENVDCVGDTTARPLPRLVYHLPLLTILTLRGSVSIDSLRAFGGGRCPSVAELRLGHAHGADEVAAIIRAKELPGLRLLQWYRCEADAAEARGWFVLKRACDESGVRFYLHHPYDDGFDTDDEE